jgi:hypothetical protein
MSRQLLEIAKTGVERALEIDQATAIAWMNINPKSKI